MRIRIYIYIAKPKQVYSGRKVFPQQYAVIVWLLLSTIICINRHSQPWNFFYSSVLAVSLYLAFLVWQLNYN